MICKVHPKYKAIRKPTSKRPGCICAAIYSEVVRLRARSAVEASPDRMGMSYAEYLTHFGGP